jgi:hypothetical protein
VTCRDVDRYLIAHAAGQRIPPEAATHIASCEHCTRLLRALRATGPTVPVQLPDVQSAILADLKPVKPIASSGLRFAALALLVAFVAAAGAAVLGTAGWHALSLLQRAAVFGSLGTTVALLALSLSFLAVPGSRVLLPAPLLVAAALALMAVDFATLFHPHQEPTFVATGLVCLRIGLECAAAAGFLFWVALRRGAILNPVAAGAIAGALAGLAGLTVLEIFCPNLNQHHVLVWHLGAALASTLAGAAIGTIVERT